MATFCSASTVHDVCPHWFLFRDHSLYREHFGFLVFYYAFNMPLVLKRKTDWGERNVITNNGINYAVIEMLIDHIISIAHGIIIAHGMIIAHTMIIAHGMIVAHTMIIAHGMSIAHTMI